MSVVRAGELKMVNVLRKAYYPDWEGMHATPSNFAITQNLHRMIFPGCAETLPEKLSSDYIWAHWGDRHGSPDVHRVSFPDDRVGSHSALARPNHGLALIDVAVKAVTADYEMFSSG